MFKQKISYAVLTAFALVAMLLAGTLGYTSRPLEVQAAVITPVVANNTNAGVRNVEWFNKRKITATTRVCKDLSQYDVADIQWVVDEGTANSMTLKMQYTIDGINFVDGPVLVASSNTSDVTNMGQYALFGLNTCAYIRVTNGNTITLSTLGVAK